MHRFLFISIVLMACSGPSPVPREFIAQDKMQTLLFDLIKADEMVDFYRVSDSTYQPFAKRTALYDSVFGLHKVTRENFQRSLRYYQGRPDILKDMFDEMYKEVTDTTKSKQPAIKLQKRKGIMKVK